MKTYTMDVTYETIVDSTCEPITEPLHTTSMSETLRSLFKAIRWVVVVAFVLWIAEYNIQFYSTKQNNAVEVTHTAFKASIATVAQQPQITKVVSIATPMSTNLGVSILGGAVLNVKQVDAILCNAHSPACGDGSYFVEYAQQYDISDAFVLAVFQHESSFGKSGCAYYNHSISNTEPNRGYVGDPTICNGRFAYFPNWSESIENQYQQLSEKYVVAEHRTTVEAVVAEYAPSSENDTEEYIQAVEASMKEWVS